MIYKVVFERSVFDDLDRIRKFIAKDNPLKAFEWIEKLEDRAKNLIDNPRQGKTFKGQYRLLIVDNGYKIFYRVNDAEKQIYIVAIYEPRFPENRINL